MNEITLPRMRKLRKVVYQDNAEEDSLLFSVPHNVCDFILHVNGKMSQRKNENENENELLHLVEQEIKKYLSRNYNFFFKYQKGR